MLIGSAFGAVEGSPPYFLPRISVFTPGRPGEGTEQGSPVRVFKSRLAGPSVSSGAGLETANRPRTSPERPKASPDATQKRPRRSELDSVGWLAYAFERRRRSNRKFSVKARKSNRYWPTGPVKESDQARTLSMGRHLTSLLAGRQEEILMAQFVKVATKTDIAPDSGKLVEAGGQ